MTEAPERICLVNCGLPADQCACYRQMLDPMPRPDATLPPPYSIEAVALQSRIVALESDLAKAEAALAETVKAERERCAAFAMGIFKAAAAMRDDARSMNDRESAAIHAEAGRTALAIRDAILKGDT